MQGSSYMLNLNHMIKDLRLKHKTCSTCKNKLSVSDFARNSHSPDGYRSNCRECARGSKARWYVDNKGKVQSKRKNRRDKTKYFVICEKQKPCMDCGKQYHHTMMEFDHVRGVKSGTVSEMITSFSINKLKAEIAKCDLVCALCHRARTWNRSYPDNKINSSPINECVVQ